MNIFMVKSTRKPCIISISLIIVRTMLLTSLKGFNIVFKNKNNIKHMLYLLLTLKASPFFIQTKMTLNHINFAIESVGFC